MATARPKSVIKSKWFVATFVAVALVGLYALFGFYAAPKLVRSQAIEFVRENYDRELQIGEVRVHPFRLQLEIKDLAFPDVDQQTMLGFRRLFIDFEIASLWNRAFTFKDVDLESPSVRAVIRPDGSVNLTDLALPEEPDEPESPLPGVWLQSFVITDGRADFVDQARATVYEHRFAPIALSLADFRTDPEGGEFALSAKGQQSEQLEWRGQFALAPRVASKGQFSFTGLRAVRVDELLGDALPFDLSNGLINFAGSYDFMAGDVMQLQAHLPRIEASALALRARDADADWVTVPSLLLSDTRIAQPAQTVAIANITLTGMTALVWQGADGTININELFAPSTGPSAAPASAASASAAPASAPAPADHAATTETTEEPWQVTVAGVDVRNATIDFEDRMLQPAVKFAIAPLNVGVQSVTLDLAKPLPVEFDAKINGAATLSGQGALTPEPLVADIDFTLDGFDLRDLQPYVAVATDMTIQRGTLGMTGKLGMAPPGGSAPEMSFAGDVRVAGFRSIDNALEQDFFLFERVELRKLRYTMLPDALSIERVSVVKPFNRVIIGSNQILNVSAVFDPAGTAAAVKVNAAAAAAAKSASTRKKSRSEIRAEKKAAASAEKAGAATPPPPTPEFKETGMPIRIRELRVQDGRMDFADYSIQPNFAANITGLNGSVTGMSSDPNARAEVDLKGNVGEFSPVTIAGDVQPFAFDRHTNIGLKFENISLPIFNPYSGKFAGYNIAKGKLTTDLHYTIDNRKLQAKHNIRIDQLEWGEATAEKGEATLPVKFATSLLKDADGVIRLDVPVNGTLDDPKFRVWPIVWQVIKNVLSKAVTAPFRALAGLFADAEDAQFVVFVPGQASLDRVTSERLAGLAKTLAPKTDIRLDVPIGIVPELDQAALAETRYEAELQAAMAQVLHAKKSSGDAPLPEFDTLDPERKIEVLTTLVTRLAGAAPALPPAPTPPEDVSRKETKALAQTATIEYLQKEAHARVTPEAGELEGLGQKRAEAIQSALLTQTGLDPARVFLVRNGKVAAQERQVRFELAME